MKEQKKFHILQSAHALFWKHGFKRVSIEEVCRHSRVSKMTFYHYFPNKVEVAKAVFDKIVNEGNIRFKQMMQEQPGPEKFVQNLLLLKLETTKSISKEFLQDFYSHPELGLKQYVEEKTRYEWRIRMQELKIAQKKGLFRKEVDLEFFFQMIMKMGELVSDETLMKIFKKPQDLIMALAKLLTYGIAVPEK